MMALEETLQTPVLTTVVAVDRKFLTTRKSVSLAMGIHLPKYFFPDSGRAESSTSTYEKYGKERKLILFLLRKVLLATLS